VQHVNSLSKTDCIDGAKSISGVILDNLQNTGTFSFPWFSRWMLAAKLCHLRAIPTLSFAASGKANRSFFADPIQYSGFSPGTGRRGILSQNYFIPKLGLWRFAPWP
jgi:hypothetical protein